MVNLEVLNPVADKPKRKFELAPRLSGLSGKTIALVNALERLQIAQNNVRDKLRALELSLSSYPSIPIGSKT